MRDMAAMDTSAISRAKEFQRRKAIQSGILNQTIWFPRRQQQHLVASRTRRHPMSLLLIN
jgi:hypothetical protein